MRTGRDWCSSGAPVVGNAANYDVAHCSEVGVWPAGALLAPSVAAWLLHLWIRVSFSGVSAVAASVLAAAATFLQLRQHLVEREAAGFLPRRELDIALQMLAHHVLRRDKHEGMFDAPLVI